MKACQLITAKDVQGVLGDGYSDAQVVVENQTMSQCAYTKGKEAVKEAAVSITLQQTIYDSLQYLKMTQQGIRQNGGPPVVPVGGLGEGAFYVVDPGKNPPIFLLQFGKGNLEVILSVLTGGGKPNIDAAQKLAKIAYSRLK